MHNSAIKIPVYQSWSSPGKDIVVGNETAKCLWSLCKDLNAIRREVHSVRETKQRVTSSEKAHFV